MKEVIICSFNVRNKYWIKNWDGESYPEKLAKYIKDKKFQKKVVSQQKDEPHLPTK